MKSSLKTSNMERNKLSCNTLKTIPESNQRQLSDSPRSNQIDKNTAYSAQIILNFRKKHIGMES